MVSDKAWLYDMLLYARKAVDLTQGFDRDRFLTDTRTHLAVIHTIVIVGEAAAQVTDESRSLLPEIPWGQIVGMRNKLIHHYFKTDLEILWKTLQDDIPVLIQAIEQLLPTLANGDG